jgi:outer membrane protein OmpA-like peptidoglycan-associated protein
MQKKTLFTLLAMLTMLAISMPALSIELPDGATPVFEKSPAAYSSSYKFNGLLEAYGLEIDPQAVSSVPASYAKVSGDKVTFNDNSTAYTPAQYHSILSAYGLLLLPEDVAGVPSSYAKVQNDKIVFGNDSIAYGGSEWKAILDAYSLPVVVEEVVIVIGDEDGDGVPDDIDACPGTPMGVAVDERCCWALSNALLFAFDSAVIKKENYYLLDYLKEAFDAYPNMKVEVDGYTDSTGPEGYNMDLSVRRAESVRNYLVNNVGIAADRLTVKGYGESNPAYPNDTKENRAKNRRVEFTPVQ